VPLEKLLEQISGMAKSIANMSGIIDDSDKLKKKTKT